MTSSKCLLFYVCVCTNSCRFIQPFYRFNDDSVEVPD